MFCEHPQVLFFFFFFKLKHSPIKAALCNTYTNAIENALSVYIYIFHVGYLLNTNKDVMMCCLILPHNNEFYNCSSKPKFIECRLHMYSKDTLYEICISKIHDKFLMVLSIYLTCY